MHTIAVSVKGPSHHTTGLPNQDFCKVRKVPTGWLAVVCDGMGSKQFADIGSRIATQAVYDVIKKSSFQIDSKHLIKAIYQQWLNLLDSVAPREAVTTCLIAWYTHDGRYRTFQLGDGLLISSRSLTAGQHKKLNNRDFGNVTTGLGISTKYSDWTESHGKLGPSEYLALMTDGISEDITEGLEDDFIQEVIEHTKAKSARQAKTWLKNELRNWATPNHLDDKTLALLVLNNER
ncbi:PP2C family serine/threonine-protein phosphatase [Vibrio sp. 1F255]|uniref:PP2C family serine/threonine-protein phosphatase n=1 Tax=Vibrio sp. 1F255 TaxID=3230009 RepID=UPI00352D8281